MNERWITSPRGSRAWRSHRASAVPPCHRRLPRDAQHAISSPCKQAALYDENKEAAVIAYNHIMASWKPRRQCFCSTGWGACCSVVRHMAAPLPAFVPRGSLAVLDEEVLTEDMAAQLCWGYSPQQPLVTAPIQERRGAHCCGL